MKNLKLSRLRRARRTRAKIALLKIYRLSVHRSNKHIYAQIIDDANNRVLTSASTLEKEVRNKIINGGTVAAAEYIGQRIAEKSKELGIETVAFDRSGYKYHGRVKALAESARNGGIKF
ncbi:50S ribosomal protein L18 [Nitrosomonas communis]|uniref:50S ribosomal protein L18 n=1 Tax=Nitrosomonas communis TaxID=44574 RepID=UPI0026ED578F|nr:50S ribosomal protein L18 [Nitrosomonas communis]MCO6428039.1 50S ribosomal protein L18 [Nitrosomonas communis]